MLFYKKSYYLGFKPKLVVFLRDIKNKWRFLDELMLATIKNYENLPNWELFAIFALLKNKM